MKTLKSIFWYALALTVAGSAAFAADYKEISFNDDQEIGSEVYYVSGSDQEQGPGYEVEVRGHKPRAVAIPGEPGGSTIAIPGEPAGSTLYEPVQAIEEGSYNYSETMTLFDGEGNPLDCTLLNGLWVCPRTQR